MKKKIFMVAAVIISSQLQAQQDSSGRVLDEVIITANKFEQKQSSTGKVISVIDQATLQRNAGKTLTEILNYQTGVFINGANNALGTNQDFYLRGASSGKALILIDGIPAGDPSQIDNSYDLNNINPSQVERIEILKGAQSTLWGSDAMAGVINIITKKGGAKKISPSVSLSYGSYNTFKANAGISGTINGFSYNLNYNHTNSKGFSAAHDSVGNQNFDKDGFRQNNLQANLSYQFSSKFLIKSLFSYGKYKADIDAGAFADDKDDVIDNTNFLGNLELSYKAKNVALHLSNSIINAKRLLTDDSTSVGGFAKYSTGSYKGNSVVTELYGNISLSQKLSLVAGAQRIGQKTDQSYYSLSIFGPYSTALGDSAKSTTYSAYASLLLTGLEGFNIEAGARYNHHSTYGSNTTFTFNPSYNIDENTKLFINISSGFKTPSLYELYSEYRSKTGKLKPEESKNYELGVQAISNNKKNILRIVAFKRDIKNLIVFYTSPTFESYYINRDEQHDYGFELEASTGIGQTGSWKNNFTYVDGEGENNNVKIKNLYRRPNFTINSVLTLQPAKGLTVSPSFRFVSPRLKGPYDAGPETMPQYYTINLYTGYDFTKNIRAFADLGNITNQEYFDIVGYNSRRFNFSAGLSLNF